MSPAVSLAALCLQFARVERATHHPDGERPETDADHTIMLATYACALAERLNETMDLDFDLDVGLVAQFAIVHDYPEAYAGDTNTFGEFDREAKNERELAACRRIRDEHGDWPWLAGLIFRYRRQAEREARFVRYLDKFVVKFTHTLNGGASLRKMGVDLVALERRHTLQCAELAAEYPEFAPVLGPMLRAACDEAEAAFAAAGGGA